MILRQINNCLLLSTRNTGNNFSQKSYFKTEKPNFYKTIHLKQIHPFDLDI